MTESYINWHKQEHLRAVVLPDKDQYYTDLINIEHSWSGRLDGNISNTFIMSSRFLQRRR